MAMSDEPKILRKWTGVIRTADEQVYVDYIKATGLEDYESTPGNLGFQMVLRARGDGTSEVTTLSWWTSLDAIKAFAGDDPEVARYYPEDDRFLVERPKNVDHYRIVAGSGPDRT
jgi:heme-degrading monooxygenase HmoA